MCGRYALKSTIEEISEIFHGRFNYPEIAPSYNIAPTQKSLIATGGPDEYLGELAEWGLVPHWMKEKKRGFINARSETFDVKPSFKNLYPKKLCAVLADGFFEWATIEGVKRPVYFYLKNRKPFAFAGLWEHAEEGKTFTILTTEANPVVAEFHERMPVVLPDGDHIERWVTEGDKELLAPLDPGLTSFHVVSRVANSPHNNTPECIEPDDQVSKKSVSG